MERDSGFKGDGLIANAITGLEGAYGFSGRFRLC
jgi:hypothetical protein